MYETDEWIETIVIGVYRDCPVDKEVVEAACRVRDLVQEPQWPQDLAAGMATTKSNLKEGWQQRFESAAKEAMGLVGKDEINEAAHALREVVREMAIAAIWTPTNYFSFDDITDAKIIEKNFLDRSKLEESYQDKHEGRLDEMFGHALRLHSALTRTLHSAMTRPPPSIEF